MTYKQLYDTAIINPKKMAEVSKIAARIMNGKPIYDQAAALSGAPWWFIAVIHNMEGAGKFSTHLHNGDPLTARTVHVPKGRPVQGNPPFTWIESAMDALRLMGYDKVHDWSIDNALHLFERYNGMGYSHMHIPSPYLWSYTQHYIKGKYGTDGHYDPELVSKQAGSAVIMKRLGV